MQFETLTRPGLSQVQDNCDEPPLPALCSLSELLREPASANGGLSRRSCPRVPTDHVSEVDVPKMESLVDRAARIVGKTCSSSYLEDQMPSLDESVLCKVAYWSFPRDVRQIQAITAVGSVGNSSNWVQGTRMYRNGRVREMWQVGFMLTAYISKYVDSDKERSLEVRVSLTFEKQSIVSGTCSDCTNGIWCSHMVCAIIYRIKEPEKVRVHAPMTETLSTLNRDQLQKILQYAVQEDPAGILGKLFKYIDNIRDRKSEMNSITGAPDPTFGNAPSEKTAWQLSLDKFGRAFKSAVPMHGYSYRLWVSTQNTHSADFFFGKILDLVQAGDVMAAMSALDRITKIAFFELRKGRNKVHERLCYKLVRLYTQFMLYFGHNEEYRRVLLIQLASHQRSTVSVMNRKLEPSEWAELPSIQKVCGQMPDKSLARGLFTEPLLAQNVVFWPPELTRLLNEEVPIEKCTYNEDVRLMLARLESLLTLEESTSAYKKAGILSAYILRILVKDALDDSVLGENLKTLRANHRVASPFLTTLIRSCQVTSPPDSPSSLPSTSSACQSPKSTESTPSKRQKLNVKRRSGKKRKSDLQEEQESPVKKTRMSSPSTPTLNSKIHAVVPLPKSSVLYAMLYCCSNVILCERQMFEPIQDKAILAGFCAFALELSRCRWLKRHVHGVHDENNCLREYEGLLKRYLISNPEAAKEVLQLYVEAWKMENGVTFYKGLLPFVLTDIIFSPERSSNDWSSPSELTQLAAGFILYKSGHSDEAEAVSEGEDLAEEYFKTFIRSFFSHLDLDEEGHLDLLLKVLDHFEKCDKRTLLMVVKDCIKNNTGKFREKATVLQKCCAVFVQALSHVGFWDNWSSSDVTYICGLIAKLGVKSLSLLHGKWDIIFHHSNLVSIVDALNLRKEPKELPQEAAVLLIEYFGAPKFHDTDVALSLLECYDTKSQDYREVIGIISENYGNFFSGFLFEIAKREQEKEMESKKETESEKEMEGTKEMESKKEMGSTKEMGNKKETDREKDEKEAQPMLTPEAFSLVEKAVKNLKSSDSRDKGIPQQLNWVYTSCSCSKEMFEKVVKAMVGKVNNSAAIISIVVFASKEEGLKETVRPLHESLIKAYKNDFTFIQTYPGSYPAVIISLKEALDVFVTHIPDGEQLFHTELLSFVRSNHCRKKKLLGMLDDTFGAAEMTDSD